MFEKYDINDLFLASIEVMYAESNKWDIITGGFFRHRIKQTGYRYSTILLKDGEKFIDLQDNSIKIDTTRNPKVTSYVIEYMEPLSKYYTQKGKKKNTLSKRKALKKGKQYYEAMHQEHFYSM